MDYLPINLDLRKKKCLVVGAGPEAASKVALLKSCGARVEWAKKNFHPSRLKDCVLAVVGETDEVEIRRTSGECKRRGILVNAVDRPALCTFIFPAILSRGPLTVAIGTSGKSPALAKALRDDLEKKIGREYSELLKLIGKYRPAIARKFLEQKERLKALRTLANKRVLGLVRRGKLDSARKFFSDLLK